MINCIFCKCELTPETTLSTEEGPLCINCGVPNEPTIEDPIITFDIPEPMSVEKDILNCAEELTFVRNAQIESGETENVIMKRSLLEIIAMMERDLQIAKLNAIKLDAHANLRSRYHVISALLWGLIYASTHGSPHA